MKKTKIIIGSIVVVIVIAAGAYFLGARSKSNVNVNTGNTSTSLANTNQTPPKVTYEENANSGKPYTFEMVREWTSVAPSEVEKSLTPEQLRGYKLVYYSTNSDVVVFAVSEKKADINNKSLADIVNEDITYAQDNEPGYTIINKQLNTSDAKTEANMKSGNRSYFVYSRYLVLPATADGKGYWVLIEVSVPTSQAERYRAIANQLLDMVKIASGSLNTNSASSAEEFSANGEKINDPVFTEKFQTIELGSLLKNSSPATATYGISQIQYATQNVAYHVVTTDKLTDSKKLVIKAYDYAAKKLFDGSQSMDIKPGENSSCCFAPPGQGTYQYLFYLDGSLIKTVELKAL
jgi:hypothetical protein